MMKSFHDSDLQGGGHDRDPVPEENAVERLAKQKDDIAGKVASAAEEIERLRMRQEELEFARKELQELNRKQESYAQAKKEMIAGLSRGILQMEKDELRASRMVELLSSTRLQFKTLLAEIRDLHEERWNDADFEEGLDRALALLDNARMVYHRALAKLDAENWSKGDRAGVSAVSRDETGRHPFAGRGFWFWLKIGLALTLPAALWMALMAGLLIWLSGWF